MTTRPLCRIDDIADPGSEGFRIDTANGPLEVMAIRRGDAVFAYVNVCPHVGTPLDLQPGQFLDYQKTHIICSTHGALFRIDDGYCISGPCAGKSLTAVDVANHDGALVVVD